MKTWNLLVGLSAAMALFGCQAPVDPGPTSEPLGESGEAVLKKSSYFIVTHPDYRKCAYPFCGGWFVKAVNRRGTVCANGKVGAECHAADLDVSEIQLSPDEEAKFESAFGESHALVRGYLRQVPDAFGNLVNTLVATEAWRGVTASTATGAFYGVTDSGIVCVTSPCPSFHEIRLNTAFQQNIHGVDLDASGANAKQVQDGFDELYASGILVAGVHGTVTGPAGTGTSLVASELYSRVKPGQEQQCGGFLGLPCPDGEICDITVPNACSGADLPGVCRVQPDACPDYWDPVCGCNGKTYGNDCERLMANVQLDHTGACGEPCGNAVCGEGTYCCNASCSMCAPEGGVCIQIACQDE